MIEKREVKGVTKYICLYCGQEFGTEEAVKRHQWKTNRRCYAR